jgi:hypothetical protein
VTEQPKTRLQAYLDQKLAGVDEVGMFALAAMALCGVAATCLLLFGAGLWLWKFFL